MINQNCAIEVSINTFQKMSNCLLLKINCEPFSLFIEKIDIGTFFFYIKNNNNIFSYF